MENDLIKPGQGRSEKNVKHGADIIVLCLVVAIVCVAAQLVLNWLSK
jgi:hypothetical protein